jgi:ABC-type transporter Mla subunit MlaD
MSAIANLRAATDHANGVVGGLDSLVATNSGQIDAAVSNVVFFSHQLTQLASNANGIISTNGTTISGAMTNLEVTTATLRQIADDMHYGKGLAGTVLENEQLAANVQETANNLAITTSNLNEFGLWHILWRHESETRTNRPSKTPSDN